MDLPSFCELALMMSYLNRSSHKPSSEGFFMRSLSSRHFESSHFAAPRKAFTHTPGYEKSLRDGKRLSSSRQLEGASAPAPPNLPGAISRSNAACGLITSLRTICTLRFYLSPRHPKFAYRSFREPLWRFPLYFSFQSKSAHCNAMLRRASHHKI